LSARLSDFRFDVETRYDLLPSIGWPAYESLIKKGVPSPALAYDIPAFASVVYFPDRPLFDFAEDVGDEGAAMALVFLAYDEQSEVIDLVAWSSKPDRLAAWYGAAAMLGGEQIWAPRIANEGALPVFETVLDWLRADRQGVVVVDEVRAAPLLYEAQPLFCTSIEHASRLRERITPRPPKIFVPKALVRSAA
jgi:hypothetical protein